MMLSSDSKTNGIPTQETKTATFYSNPHLLNKVGVGCCDRMKRPSVSEGLMLVSARAGMSRSLHFMRS